MTNKQWETQGKPLKSMYSYTEYIKYTVLFVLFTQSLDKLDFYDRDVKNNFRSGNMLIGS